MIPFLWILSRIITTISRVPTLSSRVVDVDDTDGVYHKVVNSLASLKGKIKENIYQPDFSYILLSKLMES